MKLSSALLATLLSVTFVAAGSACTGTITDGGFNEIDVLGWCFVANCIPGGIFGNCICDEFVAPEEASWSDVKALY